jgi:hypothetical protein
MDVCSSIASHYQPRHKLTASQGFYAYSYGTAAWLALQAVPLMISPAIINTILSPGVHQLSCKPYQFLHSVIEANILLALEEYYSRSLGIALLTLALLCVLLTGAFPLTISSSDRTYFILGVFFPRYQFD